MKHRPQLPDESVNVSNLSPLRELLRLGTAVLVIGALVFFVTGLLVDGLVTWLPADTGRKLRPQVEAAFHQQLGPPYNGPHANQTRELFDKLIGVAALDPANYSLLIVDNSLVNAYAGPANVIVVPSGLLESVESENELAMVLGHELGHLQNRDPMRSLGRGIILSGLTALILGQADPINNQLILSSTGALDRRYSRRAELAADQHGLSLVCQVYGHRGGAAEFFERLGDDEFAPAFFSTHPLSEIRVVKLQEIGNKLDCPIGPVTPLTSDP